MARHASFSNILVLNRYLLSHFGVTGFKALSEELKSSAFEGRDENNVSNFFHEIHRKLFLTDKLSEDQLLEYDQNIVSHTLSINEKRDKTIEWKYFQYLSLLFTEIYLDKFFQSRQGLLWELNEYLDQWNDLNDDSVPNPEGKIFEPFQFSDINKLAFWNSTGSGKTLIMHINILQYEYWRKKYGDDSNNKILLVTPNGGLSKQHLAAFEKSDIPANLFSRGAGAMFSGEEIEILEISKLAEEHGGKTVSYEAFETNNLVLIDEGHRGVAGEVWKYRRDYLSEDGFAFEYSATFGQSVAASGGKKRKVLVDEYAKNIIFDYSYKHFYRDGYGKDYHILNLADDENKTFVKKYLTGALLSFYQQKLVFKEHKEFVNQFYLANPLWIFVGGTVTKTLSKSDAADIPRILKYFQWFIQDEKEAKKFLNQLLTGKDGILDQQNRSIFRQFFDYIRNKKFSVNELYRDIMEQIFNTSFSGANLYLDNLNGIDGELGIRVGDSEYFGVINIGADRTLYKKCQEEGLPGLDKDFSESLFHGIKDENSNVNVLIGAKKFTEGWSSWRVSTMGLMNVGRSEGAQIIQLFGRGVRLKGYNWTLKRSTELDEFERPKSKTPEVIRYLETLNIFGIRSDYMQKFKEFLEEEGLPANDSIFQKIKVPILPQVKLDNRRLKILTVSDDVDFKKDVRLELKVSDYGDFRPITLDWYPKVQVYRKAKGSNQSMAQESNICILSDDHTAFADWDQIYFELQKFKNERSWYNLSIEKSKLAEIISNSWWYDLYIPEDETQVDSFSKVRLWNEIIVSLLKAYAERYYNRYKSEYMSKHMKTEWLTPEHPNFEEEYEIQIKESETRIIENLSSLVNMLNNDKFKNNLNLGPDFEAFNFLRHLYKPLLYINQSKYEDLIKIAPVALVNSEWRFVKDLREYYLNNEDRFEDTTLCLLRNQSRKGVGFFEAHGFYPDFILWLNKGQKQNIVFIDPKGLRQVTGFDHPKICFYKTIKEEIEHNLDDSDVSLNSFIVTTTNFPEVKFWDQNHDVKAFNNHHVYFMNEQKDSYIESIVNEILE